MKQRRKTAAAVILLVLTALFLLFGRSAQWALEEWGGLNLDEILYTLTQPLHGTDPGILRNYAFYAVLPAAAAVFVIGTAALFLDKKGWKIPVIPVFCVIAALFGIFQTVRFGSRLGVLDYLKNSKERSTYIEDNYVDPEEVELTFPEKKRNLIYLYLESMEVAYSDRENGGIFEENYIPELTQIAKDTEDFGGSDAVQLNGASSWKYTTWTMGGMFAATTGLPLKIPLETQGVDTNYMSTQDSFFPHITALGDILLREGYVNDLLIGSDATFGGRRLYFSTHGDYQFHDYLYYSEHGLPPGYKAFWGFEDQKLFSFAKERLGELASTGQPFNLTMLTVDTHYPNGYVCSECENTYPSQYANVIACSDRQGAEFLEWCTQQDWYEDTAIVVSGDHPTMATFCDGAPEDYTRKVYTAYLNPAASPVRDEMREYSTVDNFPTTLAAMGVQIEGDRLGMGTNLFSDLDTLEERDGAQKIESELSKTSAWMSAQAHVKPVTADITYGAYDEENSTISFTIRNVSSDRIDGFRCCMRMYGYKTAAGSDYIKWISAQPDGEGGWHAEWKVPNDQDYNGIIKLQATCMVDGARSHVLDLHYYAVSFDSGGENCRWYECDTSGRKLEGGLGNVDE